MSGFLHHLPFADYRKLPGEHISDLKELSRSPMKYRHRKDHPGGETPAMALGTATHTAVLEPHKLLTDYTLWDQGDRRGKGWEAFKATAEAAGKRILTKAEFDLVQGMRDSVRDFLPAMKYLKDGEAEVTMQWTEPLLGTACIGRLDWLTKIDGKPVLVGLKTAKDARHFKFAGQAYALGYHLQWAYYYDGFYHLTGEFPKVVEIVVENTAPFEPAVYEIPGDILALGHDEYMRLLELLQKCEAANSWPPSLEDEQVLTLPTYAYGRDDDDLSDLGLTA